MLTFTGKGAAGGIVIGRISVYKKGAKAVKRYHVTDIEKEVSRFACCRAKAEKELEGLYEQALKEIGKSNAAIFEIHKMMLDDEDYKESIENIIRSEEVNCEYAVSVTADNFAQMFLAMDDEYMKARAADVRDISERIISILQNNSTDNTHMKGIVLADDLTPSETLQMDKDKVSAFVTVGGSLNSHTAILARTMNIPAIIGCKMDSMEELDGKEAIADGFSGNLIVEPDEDALVFARQKIMEETEKRNLLESLKGKESITADGKKIKVYANIGGLSDLGSVLENDAGGIGLFRSEFLYLEKNSFPTEEEQFSVYRRVVQTMGGKEVIIRTLDIGADKKIDYFGLAEEENPALGYRAIRICLDRKDIFKTQLRAIYRASSYGKVGIMFPMITSVDEVRKVKKISEEVKRELKAQNLPFEDVELGIMIETPAAAVISDDLAKEVDFFSIGTNDLTQYVLAADRQNPKLDNMFEEYHPAIFRLIEHVVKNAHENGIWAGICGELGGDTTLTERFIKMGVDELSVSPPNILPIRKIISECTVG